MLNQHDIELQTGKLQISVSSARYSLDSLLTFGSRQNPKRRYLFISKVLGKYVPCKPSEMRQTYRVLAEGIQKKCAPEASTWVLGVAETATGLGAGVAQELKRHGLNDVVYSHTTRCELSCEVAFSIIEEHSHAPSHLIYAFNQTTVKEKIETVVIVDDEISTGKTLEQLTRELDQHLPNLKHVIWTSLVNWLSVEQRETYQQAYPQLTLSFDSLLDGSYQFVANEKFDPKLPDNTASGISTANSRADIGRTGYWVSPTPEVSFYTPQGELFDITCLDTSAHYTVIGTGEFTYQPFLLAEQMQNSGFDVLFQSTGRSPMLQSDGISRKESFFDATQQGIYYLYNQPQGRQSIMFYETEGQYLSCPFREKLDAIVAILA